MPAVRCSAWLGATVDFRKDPNQKHKMDQTSGILLGAIIGWAIGSLICLVFTVVALKKGWDEKFLNWIDRKW